MRASICGGPIDCLSVLTGISSAVEDLECVDASGLLPESKIIRSFRQVTLFVSGVITSRVFGNGARILKMINMSWGRYA